MLCRCNECNKLIQIKQIHYFHKLNYFWLCKSLLKTAATLTMDSDSLKIFVTVAELHSFTQAGKLLHLTQPAISKRIGQLEDQLGVALFDRIGRQILLTDAGKTLLPRARAILNDVNDLKRSIDSLSTDISGTLALGTSHHIGLHRLPPYLRDFHRYFPRVKLNIKFMESEEIYELVIQGKLELGIVTLPAQADAHVRTQALWLDSLHFMVSKDHALNSGRRITLSELLEYPAILPESNTFTRTIVERIVSQQGQQIECGLSTNNLEIIRMLTKTGLGWSVLPDTLLDDELIPLQVEKTTINRELGLIFHSRRTLSNAAREFMNLLTAP